MKSKLFSLLLAVIPLSFQPGFAEDVRFLEKLSIEEVRPMAEQVRDFLHIGVGSDGRKLPPETPEERRLPILSDDELVTIFDVGLASGFGRWCGLDWERDNYTKLMAHVRQSGRRSDKETAYAAMLHGYAMHTAERIHSAQQGPCSDDQRRKVTEFFERRWP